MLMIKSPDAIPALETKLYPEASPIDSVIEKLIGLMEPGDVIIDGGNTQFQDTERRTKCVEEAGLLYIGTGVSGGEEGARFGPSIMPGGSEKAWPLVKDIFQSISAKVGPNGDIPCCEWIGARGAGHYVKMVHNGIEYGDMQLICEAYWMLKNALGLSNEELYEVFAEWNKGELDSYLIEITRDIFSVKDEETGEYLVDLIRDTAGAKGTGKWMSQLALDLGVPSTLVTHGRFLFCPKHLRNKGRPRACIQGVGRPFRQVRGGQEGLYRTDSQGALCVENLQLRPGLCPDAGGGEGTRLGPQPRPHCSALAGWMHHSCRVPGTDQRGIRQEPRTGELAPGSVL